MKNIAVFFGGQSVEHDISIITGVMTLNAIDKTKFCPIPIYVSKTGEWFTGRSLFELDEFNNLNYNKLKRVCILQGDNVLYQVKKSKLKKIESIYCAINCLHGERGEDGSLFGLLNMCNIPLTSSSLLPSAISMDKSFTKIALKGIGVPTLKSITIESEDEMEKVLKSLSFPLVIKPNLLGSSIGISKAIDKESLLLGITNALKYGKKVVIEPFLQQFTEINCAVYRDEKGTINVSECEKPIARDKILSFGDKYVDGKREFPAKIDKKLSIKIKNLTQKIYDELSFEGVIRIDYFISENKVYVNEINSVPGSLSYYLFSDTIKGFSKMIDSLIMASEKENLRKSSYIKEFSSGILAGFGSKGAKRL